MFLYIMAALIIIGSWYLFNKRIKKKKSTLIFSLIMIGVPVFFHIFGMIYASITHNPSIGFTSAYLMSVLYINSLIMLIVHFAMDVKRRKEKRGS
ncbi:hypothetical protein [Pontibacillus marinus]|uniref:Uncharacterized protein n=1 Tax=Pontibacillus marinus BH030004 = DSM 16465 TaxID=1385511 RepID=A0A0A5I4T9_9BACI|nr:hypothetical protein [Pontibacillus marinus]KGX90847.1 hypothetical protein N783_18625 [Pontibacillus marinus BH030004 = DSM 16465]